MPEQKKYSIEQIKDQTDLNYALAIRAIVFIEEQKCPFDEEFDSYDVLNNPNVIHFIVKKNNQPVATARMILEKDHQAKIGRIAILKDFRRKGLGTYFMKYLIQRLKADDYTHITINAQEHLKSFYEELGFFREGEVFDEAGIPHIKMFLA
jgi:predicted GNAT family N-acyltransferase